MTTLIREAASRCFFLLIPDPTVPMVVAGPRSKNRSEDYLPARVKYTANGLKRN